MLMSQSPLSTTKSSRYSPAKNVLGWEKEPTSRMRTRGSPFPLSLKPLDLNAKPACGHARSPSRHQVHPRGSGKVASSASTACVGLSRPILPWACSRDFALRARAISISAGSSVGFWGKSLPATANETINSRSRTTPSDSVASASKCCNSGGRNCSTYRALGSCAISSAFMFAPPTTPPGSLSTDRANPALPFEAACSCAATHPGRGSPRLPHAGSSGPGCSPQP